MVEMITLYECFEREFKIPVEKGDNVIDDLEESIKTQMQSPNKWYETHINFYTASTDHNPNLWELSEARRKGVFVNVESLRQPESSLVIGCNQLLDENQRYCPGPRTHIWNKYATLTLENDILLASVAKAKGLAYDPAFVEKILEKYAAVIRN